VPNKDVRAASAARKGKHSTAGRRNVIYKDAKGYSKQATVVDQGTSSGLKIAVGSRMGAVIDNVPSCAAENSTGCYISKY